MTAGRPTRDEAITAAEAAFTRRRSREAASVADLVSPVAEAIAELFGGFAPSPVEVPALCSSVGGGHGQVIAARVPTGTIGSGLDERQAVAIAARSNAWEELRCHFAAALASGTLIACLGHVTAAKNLMDRPEMGVGPKGKS